MNIDPDSSLSAAPNNLTMAQSRALRALVRQHLAANVCHPDVAKPHLWRGYLGWSVRSLRVLARLGLALREDGPNIGEQYRVSPAGLKAADYYVRDICEAELDSALSGLKSSEEAGWPGLVAIEERRIAGVRRVLADLDAGRATFPRQAERN